MAGDNGWGKQRILPIFSEIDQNLAWGIISQMYGLAAESPDPITLLINCNGGQVRHATAIIEAVKACPVPVNTIGLGTVFSAALFILLVGSKRYAFHNTLFMSHQFNTTPGGAVQYHDAIGQRYAEEWTLEWMHRHFKTHTKVQEWKGIKKTFLSNEHYFDEKEALKIGVIDEIVDKFPLVKIQ